MQRRTSKPVRVLLYIVAAFVGLLVLLQAVLVFVDFDEYKSDIERAASAALGLDVTLGRLGVGVLPGLHVSLADVRIRSRGREVASLKQATFGIDLLPLLRRELRVGAIRLKSPRIQLQRDPGGELDIGRRPAAADGSLPAADIAEISLVNGALYYTDRKSGEQIEAENCRLDARRVRFDGGKAADVLKRLAFTAGFGCASIRAKNLAVSNLTLTVRGRGGIYDFKPIAMQLFGGKGTGSVRADFSKGASVIDAQYAVSQLRLEELTKAMSGKPLAQGALDLTAELALQGANAAEMKRSAAGKVSLRGANLVLDGTDVDRGLARLESSQGFNLIDAGAFLFAGPVGLAVTKGYSFASVVQGARGRTAIQTLVSDWKIERGAAQAHDVAMATPANRIALKGNLDFVNERFDAITIAVVDANGCAKLRQGIRGPFRDPEIDTPGVLASLAAPALELFRKVKGGPCEIFYAGSVAAPK